MKKRTKRYTKELGKTHRQQSRDERLLKQRKNGPAMRCHGGGMKKNLKHHKVIPLQIAGQRSLKFCKRIPLTTELRKMLGREIIKILPKEVKDDLHMIPYLSVYRDTKNARLILAYNSVKHQETLKFDENGAPFLEPDINYAQARYTRG